IVALRRRKEDIYTGGQRLRFKIRFGGKKHRIVSVGKAILGTLAKRLKPLLVCNCRRIVTLKRPQQPVRQCASNIRPQALWICGQKRTTWVRSDEVCQERYQPSICSDEKRKTASRRIYAEAFILRRVKNDANITGKCPCFAPKADIR